MLQELSRSFVIWHNNKCYIVSKSRYLAFIILGQAKTVMGILYSR
jgi:hypothetical protein